jgi:hypothetical protein
MKTIAILGIFFLSALNSFSQLEKIIVERYYVTDSNDATDLIGGGVEEGSVTYRIYVDMQPGTILKSIYGDAAHPFNISSTEIFFNNESDGQSFGKDFLKARYQENTVALDTWLTIGQTTRKQGPVTHYGILKYQDDNGSFIGGVNNDGGSELISAGLLINEDPSAGIPLTIADGMDTLDFTPTDWYSNGILDFVTGEDPTIFGSVNELSSFSSDNFILQNSGVKGVLPDSNQVIIAQLTTKGELSFNINIEVEFLVDGVTTIRKYVSTNDIVSSDEEYNPFLSYPFACGCNNPDFVEYDPSFICLAEGACLTPVVIGCMDPLACNYSEEANTQVENICCYPGWCANLNIEEVCPQLKGASFDVEVYPNPAENQLIYRVLSGEQSDISVKLYTVYGNTIYEETYLDAPFNLSGEIDLSSFPVGLYQLRVSSTLGEQITLIVKI